MKIKRFEAANVQEALQAVKRELGPDAVILASRELRKTGGVFGLLGRPRVEVTAAIDRPDPEERTAPGDFTAALGQAERAYRDVLATEVAESEAELRQELRDLKEAVAGLRAERGPDPDLGARLSETCASLKGLLDALMEQQQQKELSESQRVLVNLFFRMIANGLDQPTAIGLFKAVKSKLPAGDQAQAGFVRELAQQLILGRVRVAAAAPVVKETRVIALVGPTGVGKTTTIAKLAAHHGRKKARIVTLDHTRVGAAEPLRALGKLIQVPVEELKSVAQLRELVGRHQGDSGVILVDTAGRSPFNADHVAELKGLAQAGVAVEIHLVLASTTKPSDLCDIVDRFSVIPIQYLLFTKMDETRTHAPIFATMHKKGKPISYLTTGQRVPEDIEAASPRRIADLVLGQA